jgi:lipoprotein-anchoring transpeptidase ErfK/SrfK
MSLRFVVVGAAAALLLTACNEPAPGGAGQAGIPAPDVDPAPLAVPPPVKPSASAVGQAIDQAQWGEALPPEQLRDLLIRTQVLLSRARFSPGVIDGKDGDNLKDAVLHYERANGLPADGRLDQEVFRRLSADAAPAMTDYVISQEDVAGPFVERIPENLRAMAKMDRLAYASPRELLAEKFHMDETLLASLNPNADFGRAGTTIVVAAPGPETLPAAVARVEVDKGQRQVRAYGADGRLVASYPATIGSEDMPTPSGQWEVTAIAHDPTWSYDPSKLNFGDKSVGKLTIPAGPNNPVGAVWIDLSKETYGIHGAPDPATVGKTASHGCVRLTNWDVKQLASAVSKGVKVVFVGEAAAPASKA